jgi:hypothetical protein
LVFPTTGGKKDIGSDARIGWGYGKLWNERAIMNADFRQILAEKWLLKGRMPQAIGGLGEVSGDAERFPTDWIWWKVLLQPQASAAAALLSFDDFRSQCFFVKTGTSEKAQKR